MNLQERLEQASAFLFFLSEDIERGPDCGGLEFESPEVGVEAFSEILKTTERGFIRVSLYILGSTIRVIINDLKNRHIVTVNNLYIAPSDLKNLKSAYASHREFSFAFGIFPNGKKFEIYPITNNDVVLTVKSWEVLEF